ncbi:Spo12 family protein [Aspergillus clavatus NRRL 1]|uniref:Spo12 family protein n=1 Tax=Aspergillus clavatus (strain ATCC 1007 / CBS 513.65 / DSM 816 / NCTC 3887 / NRRL 1 / QM 1276 / 107) TaxID=344612 RepID=A1C9Z1_ASPCL|nr:Spo12 family protein [Aspergillus clavatus NRRL 1]EAW12559.1 Spo12 family protein [Aspergillus clavatus NRRL 1]
MDSTTASPLTDRSTNTHLAANQDKPTDLKAASNPNSMEYHRQVLQGKLENGDKNQASYVSPSDELMSPCSKKLSDLKGKRFKNAGKPQSLFAKLGKKTFEQNSAEHNSKSLGGDGL